MIDGFPDGVPGCDFHHEDDVESFHALKAAGIVFVFVKAPQGRTKIGPLHAQYLSKALDAGLIPASQELFTYSDSILEAKQFVNNAGALNGQLPLCVNLETNFNGVAQSALDNANEIRSLTGQFPLVYCSLSFWQDILEPIFPPGTTLYLAEFDPSCPAIAGSFRQFSQGFQVPGVPAPFDVDVYSGTLDQIQEMVIP